MGKDDTSEPEEDTIDTTDTKPLKEFKISAKVLLLFNLVMILGGSAATIFAKEMN